MKRTIDYFLQEWQRAPLRKPLLLCGARQVGKTHAVRELGKNFAHFIEINLESQEAARRIIEKDLDVKRIIFQLSELFQQPIEPGATLLFFDEAQIVPQSITLLRYFYEQVPALHVVAAGSLLDFAIEQVGIPVGRVSTLYLYPLSFIEFLIATGHAQWAKSIVTGDLSQTSEPLHEALLTQLAMYFAIGGMPEAVNRWRATQSSREVKKVHADLMYAYEQDFGKYAKKHQIKYLQLIFSKAIEQLSQKFMFARVGEYQKRELAPALDLLEKAGLLYKIVRTAGQGIPLGAQADLNYFKLIFLDIGLSQALLKLDLAPWFIDPQHAFINQGALVEAFIGQELLAYADPIRKETLFYWDRDSRASEAEIDYLIQQKRHVIPIEVKAGHNKRIKSMQIFLASHPQAPYGIRLWSGPYEIGDKLKSYPLYAAVRPLLADNEPLLQSIMHLF